jgi:hypothetical protein
MTFVRGAPTGVVNLTLSTTKLDDSWLAVSWTAL